jgi:hypothetical protein
MRRTKCQSGAEKKKKRKRLEVAAQSQKGALDKFVLKESQINSEIKLLMLILMMVMVIMRQRLRIILQNLMKAMMVIVAMKAIMLILMMLMLAFKPMMLIQMLKEMMVLFVRTPIALFILIYLIQDAGIVLILK